MVKIYNGGLDAYPSIQIRLENGCTVSFLSFFSAAANASNLIGTEISTPEIFRTFCIDDSNLLPQQVCCDEFQLFGVIFKTQLFDR